VFVGISCGGEYWGREAFHRVEEAGFDGLFTGEHILFHRPVWDAVTMCTAVACATERITIGAAATIAPLRHPTLLAKEFCGVDRISHGRLVLALGVGGDYPKEFEAMGIPLEQRAARTSETLEIVRRYFSGKRFSYRGRVFELEDVWLDPPPERPGGPPLWVAGRREPTLKRAALLGDGFLPYMVTPTSFARLWRAVRDHAEAAKRELTDSYAVGVYVYVSCGEDGRETRRRGDEHLAWRYSEPRFIGDLAGKYAVSGTPEECAGQIREFAEAGATHVILSPIRAEAEAPTETIDLLGEALLPLLR